MRQQPRQGIEAFSMVWAAWLFSQEWWRRELWRTAGMGNSFEAVVAHLRTDFIPGADANNLILQMRTWESTTTWARPQRFTVTPRPRCGSIKAPVLYMPSETDLYFPLTDARYEAALIPHHARAHPFLVGPHRRRRRQRAADAKFLNDQVARFLAARH